jgi:hypothetical protein
MPFKFLLGAAGAIMIFSPVVDRRRIGFNRYFKIFFAILLFQINIGNDSQNIADFIGDVY